MSCIEGAIERSNLAKIEKAGLPPKKYKTKLSFFEGAEKHFRADIAEGEKQLRALNSFAQATFWGIPSYIFEIVCNSTYSRNTDSFPNHLNLGAILIGTLQYVKIKREMSNPDVDAKISKILERFFKQRLLFLEEDERLFFAVNKMRVFSANKVANYVIFCLGLANFWGLRKAIKECVMHYDDPAILWFFVAGAILYALGLISLYQSVFNETQYIQECIKDGLNKQRKEIIASIKELTSGILSAVPEIDEDIEPDRIFNYIRVSFQRDTKWKESNKKYNRLSLVNLNKELLFVLGLMGVHGYLEKEEQKTVFRCIDGKVRKENSISLERAKEIFKQRVMCRENIDSFKSNARNFDKILASLKKITGAAWYISKTTQDSNEMRLCLSSKQSGLSVEARDFFNKFCTENDLDSTEHEHEGAYNLYLSNIKVFSDAVDRHLKEKQSKFKLDPQHVTHSKACLPSVEEKEKKNENSEGKKEKKEKEKVEAPRSSNFKQSFSSKKSSIESITLVEEDFVQRAITIGEGNNSRHLNFRFENLKTIKSDSAFDDIAIKKIMRLLSEGDFLSSASKGKPGLKCHKGGQLRLKLTGYMGNHRLHFMQRPSDLKEEPNMRVYEYKGVEMKRG